MARVVYRTHPVRVSRRAAPRAIGGLLLAVAFCDAAQSEMLRAGAAEVPFEISQGIPLAGYGERGPGNTSRGVLAAVGARALVIEAAAGAPRVGLVVLDVLIVTSALRTSIEERVASLELDALIVAATHTHSGPGGYVDGWLSEVALMGWHRAGALASLADSAAAALARASRAMVPAALGAATASAPGLAANRRRPGGPGDATVPVLRVDGAEGQPIATLFAASAHPTVLSAANDRLSADYPGAARDVVEARRGGVALFLAGPLGDQKPRVATEEDWPADLAAQQRNVLELGERLGALVVETANFAATDPRAPVGTALRDWHLPPVNVRSACAGYLLAPLLYGAARLTISVATTLTALRLGNLRLLASPLELGVEVAAAIRARSPGSLLIAAHAGDWLGYLLMPDDQARGGYETCLTFHGDNLAPLFIDRAVEVLDGLESAE